MEMHAPIRTGAEFVCCVSILRSPVKACKINGFMGRRVIYYTIFERVLRGR